MTQPQAIKYSSLLYFILQYKKNFFVLLTATLAVSFFEICQLAAMLPILNRLIPATSPNVPVPGLKFFEGAIAMAPFKETLISAVAVFAVVVIVRFFIVFTAELLNHRTTQEIIYQTKRKILKKTLASKYQFFLDSKHGDLFFICITAPENAGAYLSIFVSAVIYFFTTIAILGFLLSINFVVTCSIILLGLLYYLGTRKISVRVSYVGGQKRIGLIKEQHGLIQESLQGIKYIITYGKQEPLQRVFDRSSRAFCDQVHRDTFWQTLLQKVPEPALLLLASSGIILLVTSIGQQAVGSYLNIIGVYFFAIQRIIPALNKFSTSAFQVLAGMPNLEACQNFLEAPIEKQADGSIAVDQLKDAIRFENVSLTYPNGKHVLKSVSMIFRKGKTTAIVGESGSGKTSVVNLILGLHHASNGSILIDEHSLSDVRMSTLLSKIGYVGQETFLLHASVKDNIAFYDQYSDEKIMEAAKMADAAEFIEELPDRYDTIVGSGGMKLSGGQRQRLAIARALLRRPEILVLDEATSNLDSISEGVVQQTINHIAQYYTVIVVAHKLSTVKSADQIYVLHDGQIAESGTHEALMERRGKYYQLHFISSGSD